MEKRNKLKEIEKEKKKGKKIIIKKKLQTIEKRKGGFIGQFSMGIYIEYVESLILVLFVGQTPWTVKYVVIAVLSTDCGFCNTSCKN